MLPIISKVGQCGKCLCRGDLCSVTLWRGSFSADFGFC